MFYLSTGCPLGHQTRPVNVAEEDWVDHVTGVSLRCAGCLILLYGVNLR